MTTPTRLSDPHTTASRTASRTASQTLPGQTRDDCVPVPPSPTGGTQSTNPHTSASHECGPDPLEHTADDQSVRASRGGAVEQLEDLVDAGGVRLCRQSGPIVEGDAEAVLRFVETLRARAAGEPVCRVCGCTESMACPPTCWWVRPLISRDDVQDHQRRTS